MDEEQNNSTLDDTRKQPNQENKKSAGDRVQDAKNKIQKGQEAVKKLKSLGKLGTVGIYLAIILIIIFIAIGIFGFIMTLPGLSAEKIVETSKKFWKWLSYDDKIEVDPTDMKDLADYIESMGFDIVGYGFVQSNKVDADGGIIENDDKKITNTRYSNIYAYILANERTYTLVGTSNGYVNDKLFDYITLGGERRTIGAIANFFKGDRKSSDQVHYGMLEFDDSLVKEGGKALTGFRASIDRNSNQLVIDSGRFNVDRMAWDMSEWTARYGKPVELSLALHLSTLAPDFVYNFCMDNDLQTKIVLATEKAKYENMKYSYLKDGASKAATQSDVDKYYKKVKKSQSDVLEEHNLLTDSVILSTSNSGSFLAPIDIFFDTSVISVASEGEKTKYYKAVDKNKNLISFVNQNYEVKLDGDGIPYFEPKEDGNVQVPKFVTDSLIKSPSDNEVTKLSDGTIIRLEYISLNDLIALDNFGQIRIDGDREGPLKEFVVKYVKTIEKFDHYINHTIVKNKDEYQKESVNFSLNLKSYNKKESRYDSWTFNTSDDKKDYSDHNAEYVWTKKVSSEATSNKTPIKLQDAVNKYDFQNWIQDEVTQLKANNSQIDEIFLSDDLREYLHDTNLSLAELIELHDIFDGLNKKVDTYIPYIKNVTHHWYQDVYFIDDDYSVYEKNVSKTVTDTFVPDSSTSTPQMEEFMQHGSFYYSGSTKNAIEQSEQKQPKFVKTEPWHYKVKNWIEYGYYFIYDGSKETAESIDLIVGELKKQKLYDPTNPLLLDEYADAGKGNKTQESLSTKGINKNLIDKKAKEINKAIDEITKGSTIKSNVRLKKIDFKKQNSLTAFSILEGVHTADTDLIYEDLKKFLIELGYFKHSDFEEIETDVFEWLIPDYEVFKDEWPDPKYEKVDNEYGTYIRSKSSVDEQKAQEAEIAEKEREEKEKNSSDSETKQMSSIVKNSSSNIVLKKAKECWEYILNENRYIYNNGFGKPIPPTEQNYIDCSAYVSWVLYECGYEDFGGYQKSSGYFMSEDFKSKYGWTVISVNGDCSSKVQPGDIVARSGHVDIVKSVNSDGSITGYNCGDQSYLSKSNINGVPTTGHVKGSGPAKIIRVSGAGDGNTSAAFNVEKNETNTTVTNGVELTTVNASDYGEEGYSTITTVNGIPYKDFKQGSYPGMGVSSSYSQMCLPGCGDSFGYVGCGPTSAAVILSAYGITGTTGSDALPYLCGIEAGTHDGGTNSCDFVKKAFDHYDVPSTVHYVGQGNTKETIDQALKEGRPIVANVNGGYYSPGGHYIAILGYDDEENLVISNPCGFGIYGVCGGYAVQDGVKLDYFVNTCLGGGSGTYLVMDETPTGFSFSPAQNTIHEIEGFEAGLDIIMPESGKIVEIGKVEEEGEKTSNSALEGSGNEQISSTQNSIKKKTTEGETENTAQKENSDEDYKINVEGDYVIIEFSTSNGVSGWKMKIEGFALDTVNVKEEARLNKGSVIGITTESNMKVTLYDKKDAIIDDVEDYFVLYKRDDKKANNNRDKQVYPYDKDEVILLAGLIQGETPPDGLHASIASEWDMETCMNIGKVTGYCCINFALEHDMTITEEIYGEGMWYRYGGGMSVKHEPNISAECMECAEWCFEYDCSSVSNPDGEEMTIKVQGESGWDNCPGSNNHGKPKKLEDLTCFWVLDWPGRGTPGVIQDYDELGGTEDGFFCYVELP